MTGRLTEGGVQRMEERLGVELDYLREMGRVAPGALARMGLLFPLASYGRTVPAPVLHLARLGATLAEDCGPCVQIAVNMGREDGVPSSVLGDALHGRMEALAPELRDALAFGRSVADRDPGADLLRERLRDRYGDAGVVELALAVAAAQFYPVLKRGMGFARSCSLEGIRVEAA